MSFTDFPNPFMGLDPFNLAQGVNLRAIDPLASAAQWSNEGAIGGVVNPLAPDLANKTNQSFGGEPGDTDLSAAAKKKEGALQGALKGLQAPAAPTPQKISSPNAPQMRAQNSQLAALLASMGISPKDMLRLGQTFGR